jgi:long-chain acyl-CoA synthetase
MGHLQPAGNNVRDTVSAGGVPHHGTQGGPVREYSIPALADIPESASLADVVFSRARSDPHAVMLRRRTGGGTWSDVTASEFRDEVATLASGLIAAGIGPGDRVALMSRTRYEWTLIDYAIWSAGAVTVPVYETSSAEQVRWILSDSGARAVFAESPRHAALIAGVRDSLPGLGPTWLIDAGPGTPGPAGTGGTDAACHSEPMSTLNEAGARLPGDRLDQRRASRRSADLATIIYTSGTTGRPKGCELTHGNLLSDVRNAVGGALAEIFEIAGGSTLLFLPLAHSFARIIQIGCLESGAILGHWPDTSTVAQALPEFRPTFLLAVPRVFEKVYNTAQQQASASAVKGRVFAAAVQAAIEWSRSVDAGTRPAADPPRAGRGSARGAGTRARRLTAVIRPASPALRIRHTLFDRLVYSRLRAAVGGRVQYAVSGGAPLGERLGHFFRGAGITVLEGYGLTETSAAATVNRPSRNKIGTVGLPLPGVGLRIAPDGEILITGPNVFPGYWGDEAATAEVLDAEGWLHTGDLGELDDEGFLRVTGRKKELIVTAGGKNVAPAVLEDRLRSHPLISQVMVVGDKRPYIACLITLDPEAVEHWKQRHSRPADATVETLTRDPELLADLQAAIDETNKAVSRAESIRRFTVLPADFTEASGHLTPSLKVRRSVVAADFASEIEELYAG